MNIHYSEGYSIIEVMLSLLIMAALAAIAAPGYRRLLAEVHLFDALTAMSEVQNIVNVHWMQAGNLDEIEADVSPDLLDSAASSSAYLQELRVENDGRLIAGLTKDPILDQAQLVLTPLVDERSDLHWQCASSEGKVQQLLGLLCQTG